MSSLFQRHQQFYAQALREAGVPMPPDPSGMGPQSTEPPQDMAVAGDEAIKDPNNPSSHPAVQAAHHAFLTMHNALAEDTTPENLDLFVDKVNDFADALRTYAFGQGDTSGGNPFMEEEELDPAMNDGQSPGPMPPSGGAPQEAEETEEDEADAPEPPTDGEEEDDDEEAPKKPSFPKRKSESNSYSRASAQLMGSKGMNTIEYSNGHNDHLITYNSDDDTPWHIDTGDMPLTKFNTKAEAEHALNEWMSQSQEHMEMDGKEGNFSSDLIPTSEGNMGSGSKYQSVMGGEKQDFRAPKIGGGNFKESAASYEDLCETNFVESDIFGQASTPSLAQLQAQESNVLHPPQSQDREFLREAACPCCDAKGCGYCDETGALPREAAAQLREALNNKGRSYGSNLMWHDSDMVRTRELHQQPVASKDPMAMAYSQMAMMQARRGRVG